MSRLRTLLDDLASLPPGVDYCNACGTEHVSERRGDATLPVTCTACGGADFHNRHGLRSTTRVTFPIHPRVSK